MMAAIRSKRQVQHVTFPWYDAVQCRVESVIAVLRCVLKYIVKCVVDVNGQ